MIQLKNQNIDSIYELSEKDNLIKYLSVDKIFSVSNFEDFFNSFDKKNQLIIIDKCIEEIHYVLSYCLNMCSSILPSDEYDNKLDEELFTEINLLPNFFEILKFLVKIGSYDKIIHEISIPRFYCGLKKCSDNSNFVKMMNRQLSFIDEETIHKLRNNELNYIFQNYLYKDYLPKKDINVILKFLSNYTYDDSLYKYLIDNNLIDKYYKIINNLFKNLLSEEYREFKIGADNVKILLTNLYKMEFDTDMPLQFDLLLDGNRILYGVYYHDDEYEFIVLNDALVKDSFYENLFLIENLFHEMRHYDQAHNKKLDYNNTLFIKDNFLISYDDSYYNYDMNYDIVSVEVDARMFGRINFHKWLSNISPELAFEKVEKTKEIIKNELNNLKEFNRKVNNNGKKTTLDDLFESLSFEEKKSLISKQSLLTYEYDGDFNRYSTLDLIIKKFYFQMSLDSLKKKGHYYLETVQKIKLYNDLISKRTLTYENILNDLIAYKNLASSLNDYFKDNQELHEKFISEVRNFYVKRLPVLLIINKINSNDVKTFGELDELLKTYRYKIVEFILEENEDILDIVEKQINTNNKRM